MNNIERAIRTINSITIGKVSGEQQCTLKAAVSVLECIKKDAARSRRQSPVEVDQSVWEHIIAGRKINAIKQQRAVSGMGLAEAKDFVERYIP